MKQCCQQVHCIIEVLLLQRTSICDYCQHVTFLVVSIPNQSPELILCMLVQFQC